MRHASDAGAAFDYVVGLFAFHQTVSSIGLQAQGDAATRWLLAPAAGDTPALLDGRQAASDIDFTNTSLAAFSQATLNVTNRFRVVPGARFNFDQKEATYNQVVAGGQATADPVLIARQNSVLASQVYEADFEDFNVSGQLSLSYDVTDNATAFATYARSFKFGGVNIGGIPTAL